MMQPVATMMRNLRPLFSGLVFSIIVALAAKFISEHYGAPAMLMALLLGMAFTFLAEPGAPTEPGIEFASKKLLRFGVALLGLGITVQQIASAGIEVVFIVLAGVGLTIAAGVALARMSGRPLHFGLLAGGAVAICGASAALAISSVLPKTDPNHERDTIFTVIAITALSTLAMIVYPIIGSALGLSDHAMGVFFGATIHDVAQVVGAGYSVSDEAGATATFVKLLRVALLVPVVVTLSVVFGKNRVPGQSGGLPIPFFVIGFAALVLIGSANVIPPEMTALLLELSRWCLLTAIAALGMKTSLKKLGEVGGGAIAMVCGLTVLLAGFTLGAIKLLHI